MESDSDYVEEIYEQPYEIARKKLSMRVPSMREKPHSTKRNKLQAVFLAISIVWIALVTAWAVYASVKYLNNVKETKVTLKIISASLSDHAATLLELMASYNDLKLKNTTSTNGSNATALNNGLKSLKNESIASTSMATPMTLLGVTTSRTLKSMPKLTAKTPILASTTTSKPTTPVPLRGFHPSNPAMSCGSIPSDHPSGYYWLRASNGSTVHMFCHMVDTCGAMSGGWMRIAYVDMKQPSSKCPQRLCERTQNPRSCRKCSSSRSCASQTYQVGVTYSRVCGRVIAYQLGSLEAYSRTYTNGFDGVRLTHSNSEVHIWTFYGAIAENYAEPETVCPCINPRDKQIPLVPTSVGSHYFCDTAASSSPVSTSFYTEDPLWDGAGCRGSNSCCSFNNPPWFHRELPVATAEDIKMRICLNLGPSYEDIAIEKIDIYVQ